MNIRMDRKIQMLAATVVALFLLFCVNSSVLAAPKINIWHDDIDDFALYKNIYTTDSGSLGLKAEDTTINSATWSSSNSSVMKVSGNKNGATLEALAEGSVKVSVSASTTNGTMTDSIIASSITKITPTVKSYTKASAELLRGGHTDALSRGTVGSGFEFQIYGKCGNYYYGKVPDDYTFGDTISTRNVFILKSKLNVPATDIELDSESETIKAGTSKVLSYNILPRDIANMNENIIWNSSNNGIVSVDNTGRITAKKVGSAKITATIEGTEYSDTCEVEVTAKDGKPADKKSSKLKSVKISGYSNGFKKIKITFKAKENIDGYQTWHKLAKNKKYTTKIIKKKIKKGKVVSHTFILKQKKTYDFCVRTYKVVKGKKDFSGFSNDIRLTTAQVKLKATAQSKSKIKLSWKKIAGAKKYEIYKYFPKSKKRKAGYRKIKTVKAKKRTYIDAKLAMNKKYSYKVRAIKKKTKGHFGIASAKTKLIMNKNYNLSYVKKNQANGGIWKYVCIDPNGKQNMNDYSVEVDGSKKYSSVKYRFDGKTLEIHLYLDFVTYAESGSSYVRSDADNIKFINEDLKTTNTTCKSLVITGIKDTFNTYVRGTGGLDFTNKMGFYTKMVVHDKRSSAKYNANQKFVEVRIGKECPVNSGGEKCGSNYWYHMHGGTSGGSIYMPQNNQTNKEKKNRETMNSYKSVAGHEIGHILGLDDAYRGKVEKNKGKKTYYEYVDRCADNDETARVYYDEGKRKKYDNIMKHHEHQKKARSNDIEMMLTAYKNSKATPCYNLQSYKKHTIEGKTYSKSSVIKNTKDYQNDVKNP